ncbi:hypothetical protein P152DRAFT_459838 [Eremomyces bilateralis CBS 781.70]|uniref:Protein PNS1 n=1 Tax=Eremomyces bilateralis CBS 781.70 TaxID=1392243 RepID=A0A6G1FYV2_9PEZI|nr:uncharacterized protein P152DRAFT_459838 [Eremomyces bilateralis CBS 781.70]KAF1810964.1 hypothetical protein P152DRAFT_459838 [Eremomyces bilateralis CBS 781.70]
MFSEYASRFLAQSQSRLSLGGDPANSTTRNMHDKQRGQHALGPSRFSSSRHQQQRSALGNPYQNGGSQFARFPFGSRAQAPAPLFYSVTDDIGEEDDGEEREREVADFYALQRSRRQFGNLSGSSEGEDDVGHSPNLEESGEAAKTNHLRPHSTARNGKSSWRSTRPGIRPKIPGIDPVEEVAEDGIRPDHGSISDKGKGRLMDVDLASTIRESMEQLPAADASEYDPDDDPPFQNFRTPPGQRRPLLQSFLPQETDDDAARVNPRPRSPDRESVPPGVGIEPAETPRYDLFWSTLFGVCFASLFASFFLVYMSTDKPDAKHPIGDTIYSTLYKSYHILIVDTFVATVIGVLWLSLLRSYSRPLVYLIVGGVPIVLFSFWLYPFVTSFHSPRASLKFQDIAMRYFSFIPLIGSIVWSISVIKARHSIDRATAILEFSVKILASHSSLMMIGFGVLAIFLIWTWIWVSMFTRVFLGGHFSSAKNFFIIDWTTWWLGAFFVLVFAWTQSVISGMQRATTAAVVSQWYFHRYSVPAPTSRQVVTASLTHSADTLFGTICFASILTLCVRLPFLILPRRLSGIFTMCAYSFVPSTIASLTNPLTLTYAAIHSQPLSISARGLTSLDFGAAHRATTTLTPASFDRSGSVPLLPYHLAKLILHGVRYITALAMGFAAWVSTSRNLDTAPAYNPAKTVRGSLYAYVVGLVASGIAWGVLGAMEGVLGGIVDAAVVCWASEVTASGGKEVRYCREAGDLFGDDGARRRRTRWEQV